MTYRILITGSRDWTDRRAVAEAILELKEWNSFDWDDVVIVHGDCPTGADRIAQEFADAWAIRTERHPAQWALRGKAAGPLRNQHMVDLGANIVLAFPLGKSSGTRGCMKAAKKAGLRVINLGDE